MRSFTRREVLEIGVASLLGARPAGASGRAQPSLDPNAARVRPEFRRTLESVLVTIPGDTLSSGAGDGLEGLDGLDGLRRFTDVMFRELLDAIPAYTSIHVVARQERRDIGLRVLSRAGDRHAQLHLVDAPGVEIEYWAQDLGEPVVLQGREMFLVARSLPEVMGTPSKMSRDRKRVAEYVFGEDAVLEASFSFEGGNLAFDGPEWASRVFVGYNVVSRAVASRKALGEEVSRRRILDEIAGTFGAAEVVEMGSGPQPPSLQHIDQAFVILDGGAAVVCRLQDGGAGAESRRLLYYADQLRELGYRLSFLDHSAGDIARHRFSINVVPFVDRSTGQRRVLVPVFPGEIEEDGTSAPRSALRGKGARAHDLFRELGYEPIPVLDVTHPLGGNTHCILNVLS